MAQIAALEQPRGARVAFMYELRILETVWKFCNVINLKRRRFAHFVIVSTLEPFTTGVEIL